MANDDNVEREFTLVSRRELPGGWWTSLDEEPETIYLEPGEIREVPIRIDAPFGEPVGQAYRVEAIAYRVPLEPTPAGTLCEEYISGAVIEARTLEATRVGLDADYNGQALHARGCVSFRSAGETVTVFYRRPDGLAIPQQLGTDSAGCFEGWLASGIPGLWTVQAFWHGDVVNSSVTSLPLRVGVQQPLSDCCTSSTKPSCTYPDAEACVCSSDPYCCETAWDSLCVWEVASLGCGTCHVACSDGPAGCFEQATELCVCNLDAYCCSTWWDGLCVSEVDSLGCGTCGGGGGLSALGASSALAAECRGGRSDRSGGEEPSSTAPSSTRPVR